MLYLQLQVVLVDAKPLFHLPLDRFTPINSEIMSYRRHTTTAPGQIFSRFFEDLTIALALGPFTTPLAAPSVKEKERPGVEIGRRRLCLLYTSPSPRDGLLSRMPSSA